MTRPGIIVVDATDWLDGDGDLPYEGPNELFRNAFRVAQCIEYGGPLPPNSFIFTMIGCRRRPAGQACRGAMIVHKTERDELYVYCPTCKSEEFLISNWQDTLWAEGPPDPIDAGADPFAPIGDDGLGDDVASPDLVSADGTLDADALRARMATAASPQHVLKEVFAAAPPASEAAAEKLVGAVMELWNSTPRPDLGGKSPEEVHAAYRGTPATSEKVGRNEPCPCGSGRKYKRCCGAH